MDESVALGDSVGVAGHLAGGDAAKGGEGVMQRLVVDGLVEVLDEDVAKPALPAAGVAMRPHDADGLAIDGGEVEGVQGTARYEQCRIAMDRQASHGRNVLFHAPAWGSRAPL